MKKITIFVVVLTVLIAAVIVYACVVKNANSITSVTDCQGHTYPVVKIGEQYWMAENLQCTKYDTESERAGEILYTSSEYTYAPYYTNGRYNENSKFSGNLTNEQRNHLGLLYNWAAAMGYSASLAMIQTGSYNGRRQGICPNGWHLPSRAEWNTLSDVLGEEPQLSSNGCVEYPNVGTKLKSRSGWYSGGNGMDDYGFSGLPAGNAFGNNAYAVGGWGGFWTTDAYSSESVHYRYLYYGGSHLYEDFYDKYNAQSVRCVRD